jgi:hypothetical protein
VAWGLEHISSRELAEWIEYYKVEPFGQERADLQAGVVASTIANVNRDKKSKVYKPGDFLLKFEEETPPSPKELYNRFREWALINQVKQ